MQLIAQEKQGLNCFDEESLKEVYFSIKVQDTEVSVIMNLIKKFNYLNIPFFQLKPVSHKTYDKEIIESL